MKLASIAFAALSLATATPALAGLSGLDASDASNAMCHREPFGGKIVKREFDDAGVRVSQFVVEIVGRNARGCQRQPPARVAPCHAGQHHRRTAEARSRRPRRARRRLPVRGGRALSLFRRHSVTHIVPSIDLPDDELAAVTAAIRGVIEDDRFPNAPRLDPLWAALARLEAAAKSDTVSDLKPKAPPPAKADKRARR